MILLTDELRTRLRANEIARLCAQQTGRPYDPIPAVKFFNPLSAATWLAVELRRDGDTLFGLADLGFGCPELGCFSLSELASLRLPFGMGIEPDIAFDTAHRLSKWTEYGRRAGSIIHAEALLRRAATGTDLEIPPSETDGG